MTAMRALVVALLALSLILPATLQAAKIVLLGLLELGALVALAGGCLRLPSPRWVVGALAFSALGAVGSLFGALRGNPGALSMMTVMVAYPLLMIALLGLVRDGDGRRLDRVLFVIALALATLDIAYVAWVFVDPGNPLAALLESVYGDWAVVDSSEDYTMFTLPNIASIIFLLPYAVLRSLLEIERRPRLAWLLVVVLLAAPVALSARRALYLGSTAGVVVGLVAAWAVHGYARGRMSLPLRVLATIVPVGAVGVGAFFVGIGAGLINPDAITVGLQGLFDFRTESSNLERTLQFDSMLDEIARSPLWGHGAGAAAAYLRSYEQPWSYELFYVSMVFHYGLAGFACYLVGVLWLLGWFLHRVVRDDATHVMAAWFGGVCAFLIATATNPYLLKFDFMWVIFIPLAFVHGAERRAART